MLIEGRFPVAAPPQALMRHLFDAQLVASCLPGCETLEPVDEDTYRAIVVVGMAGINARFDLNVEVTRREALEVWAVTRGEEGGNASTLQAETRVSLQPGELHTVVEYRSEVALTGRLGRFALGMMKKKAQNLGDEFAANLQRRLEEAPAAAAPSMPDVGATEPTAPAGAARPPVAPEAAVVASEGASAPAVVSNVAPAPNSTPAPNPAPAAGGGWWQALRRWLHRLRAPARHEGS
jgi:carbon monoxide dehydrogenase subunit G